MKNKKILTLLALILLITGGSAAEFEGLYAGETASILIDETVDVPETYRPVNPLLIELDVLEDGEKISKEAVDIAASARLSHGGEDYNLSLTCGNNLKDLAEDDISRDVGETEAGSWYCYPEDRFLILESSTPADIRLKAVVDTSWRLKSGSYSIDAKIRPISLIPQDSRSKVDFETGEAEVIVSDIVTNEAASLNSDNTLYYASVRREEDNDVRMEFSGDAEKLVLWRCFSTLEGCTWKKIKSGGNGKIVSNLKFDGIYAVTEKTEKNNKGRKNPKKNSKGSSSRSNITSSQNSSKQLLQTNGKKEIGRKIEVERKDEVIGDNLFLNGDKVGEFEDGSAYFTPLDAGVWNIAVGEEGNQTVERQLSIDERTERENIAGKIKRKLESLLYKILRMLDLMIWF